MSPGTCAGIAWVNAVQDSDQAPSRGRGGNGASAGGSEGYVPVEAAGASSSDNVARSNAEKSGADCMVSLNECLGMVFAVVSLFASLLRAGRRMGG
jgi:hypothetical protein